MNKTIKRIILSLFIIALILASSYITYRYTMEHISVNTSGNTAYLTVYGNTDVYTID